MNSMCYDVEVTRNYFSVVFVDLRSYLKEKGFSKKEKQHISDKIGRKVGQLNDVMDKNGKLFIKKGKKLKEILGE